MPNQRKTPLRKVGLDDELWQQLGQAAGELGTDRSDVTRQLLEWWLRRPGARMPPRPAASERE